MKKVVLTLILLLCCSSVWAQTSLTGLWIDNRTGNDFWEINGTDEAFRFTAYGGNPAKPRYLSRGVALAMGAGEMRATARDLPGHCCGQQGSLQVSLLSPNQMQVTGKYRAIDSNVPEVNVSFILSRAGSQVTSPTLPLPSISYDAPPVTAPGQTTPIWSGVWQGDGWASFFVWQDGNKLYMYWYYSQESLFFGQYEVDGNSAQGTAVALLDSPGNTFYEQQLQLTAAPLQITMTVRRLAAPLEDGHWVSWSNAPPTSVVLHKVNDQIPPIELKSLRQWFAQNHPRALLQKTLSQAKANNQLLEQEK